MAGEITKSGLTLACRMRGPDTNPILEAMRWITGPVH
jgi:hypothetical protein